MALAAAGLLGGPGCSLTRRLAVGSMVPILENTAAAAQERDDLGMVETAFPANLLLLDGLIRTAPRRAELLRLGSFLYFGYALGFVEGRDPVLASGYYERGRDYGLRALEQRSVFRKGREKGDLEAFRRGLAGLRRDDVPALAWTGANWGRWLSLNLDSPAAIAQMPRVEALLDRLLELDPGFERGLPHALRGSYDALRPQMFGGDPDGARQHFEAALRLSERRMLLYQVFYAEFYCRQMLDEECFTQALDAVEQAPEGLLPEAQLLNEIARQRARRLLEQREELF
jgi:hypothetical protein